jgi:predicted glycoside hydrolase/deacetylase ChbG (UPF0249 family)
MRSIWLVADDYAISPAVSAAIRDLMARGRVSATSVMVVAPSFSQTEADALAKVAGGRPVGLHFTLSAPFRPLSKNFAPVRNGAFLPLPEMAARGILRRLDPAALAAEVTAQLTAFHAAFGRVPDYVDGHQHVHLFPQIRDAVLASMRSAAPQAWLRQCGRVTPLRHRLRDPKGLVLDLFSGALRARAQELGIATNSGFAGTYAFRPDADFSALLPGFFDGLSDGGLVMCHPGHVDDELRRLDPLTHLREREYVYLSGEAFPALLARLGVALRVSDVYKFMV